MSHRDVDLDNLFRAGRADQPKHRWREEREIFRQLRLGGSTSLLASRVAHACSTLVSRSPVVGVAAAVLVALGGGALYLEATTTGPSDEVISVASGGAGRVQGPEIARGVAPVEEAPIAVQEPASPEVRVPTSSVDALPSAPSPTQRPRRAAAPPAPTAASSEDDLARELASVSAIRGKIAAHEYARAREAAALHRASFPHGVLGQEVSVLEIEALHGLGDDARACSLGRRFIDAHPTSAHRDRVLALMRACER